MPMDNNAEIETVLTRSREARENNATAGQLNVEAATFKEGMKRIANNHHDFASSRESQSRRKNKVAPFTTSPTYSLPDLTRPIICEHIYERDHLVPSGQNRRQSPRKLRMQGFSTGTCQIGG